MASFRGRTKISPWKFGSSSGQTPQQVFLNTQARKEAELPYERNKEDRSLSPQVQDFNIQTHIRQKASEDVLRMSSVLPLIDDLENSYREAYAPIINQSGISGGVSAAKEYGMGVLLRRNKALRTLQGKLKTYRPAFVRASGDSGNFSVVEQQAAGEGLPQISPNFDISKTFLPDDPQQGLDRIRGLRDLYSKKYQEQVRVAETGDFRGTGYENYAIKKQEEQGSDPLGLFS